LLAPIRELGENLHIAGLRTSAVTPSKPCETPTIPGRGADHHQRGDTEGVGGPRYGL